MKNQQHVDRKLRSRTLIQIGGLVQKSGLMDTFLIEPGDDLQDYNNIEKAAELLGFLSVCFEDNNFEEAQFERWRSIGKRLLKS